MTIGELRAPEGAGRRVLVVDDEPHILSAIQDLLEDDFAVLAVADAEVALRLLEEEEVSVILSDQRMPGLSGDQFLREARKRSQATRVLITGYADLHALASAVNEGKIYGYVAKPWEPEALRTLVSKAADYFTLMQDLEHERALLNTLMHNIPDHIYFKDTAARFTRINNAMALALGLRDPGEAIGKTEVDLLPAEAVRQFYEDERQITELAQPLVDRVEQVRDEGGAVHWYSTTKVPLRDTQGTVTGLVGISRDVTQRKQAEQAIKVDLALQRVRNEVLQMEDQADWLKVVGAIHRELASLVGYTGCSIQCIDPDQQHFVYYTTYLPAGDPSQGREKLPLPPSLKKVLELKAPFYRRTRQEVTDCGDLVTPEVNCIVDVPFLGGTLGMSSTQEQAFSERDIRVLEQFAQVLSEAYRRLDDLKNLAQVEAQLRQAQKLEAIGRLTGGIAHDFNNLLTIIDGYCAIQLRRLSPDQPQYESLQEIQKAADRGTALIRQLLAFSRKQVLELKVLDLNTVVKDLDKMLRRLIGEDVELAMGLAPGLGQVKADPGQMEQVLMNLAVNARDAMPQGGTLLIETRSVELDEGYTSQHAPVSPGSYVLLEVSDTGVGMDEATQAQIFEPFFTTKAPGEGTGLGLSTVYGIIKQSGGYIWVYSELGQGTSFKIYLPRLTEETQPVIREEAVQLARGSGTVLLVEDEVPLRQLAALLLREQGYTVLEASQGKEALSLSAQHQGPIHAVVSDMVMPGMSGPELVEQLLVLRPELKVMYVSGYSADIVGQRMALKPGVVFLQKPFKANALLLKVREVLDG